MEIRSVPLAEAGGFSRMFLDYLAQAPALSPFYRYAPDQQGLDRALAQRQFPQAQRQVLQQVLRRQYEGLPDAAVSLAAIERLGQGNTFTVTTGHQLNVMTGPLYFIYKIATVIGLARQLKERHPDCEFVPVYWMATEDHDYEEIRSFRLEGRTYRWQHPQPAGPVGRLSLDGMPELFSQRKDLPELVRQAYLQSDNLAQATRKLVHALFGQYGLICLDADAPELKALARPLMRADLLEGIPYREVERSNQALQAAGYGSQAYVRPLNFFYMEGHLRERIEHTPEGYAVLNTSLRFTPEALEALIEQHPERFSPNVLLRPAYQETILPNLAYIGGPAEVVYWLQLYGMFQALQVPFPQLLPRLFAGLLTGRQQSQLDALGFAPQELRATEPELRNAFIERHSSADYLLSQEKRELQALYARIAQKATQVDNTLLAHVQAEEKRMQAHLAHTEHKMRKSEQRRHSDGIGQLLRLREALYPGGGLQERTDNFLNAYLKNPAFIGKLIQELPPLGFQFHYIALD